jgi:hypothetical protein
MGEGIMYFSLDKRILNHCILVFLGFCFIYIGLFLPRILDGSANIAGDVFAYYLPIFLTPRSLWTNLLYSGSPTFADPQFQLWYPLNRLCSLFPHTWEVFIISAYILASSFTYGYVYRLTRSRLASFASGLMYGMSGFMVGYWGYSSILHVAAWLPLLLWALDELRDRLSKVWLILGSLALACMVLAGHPQITLYGLMLSLAYALVFGSNTTVGRWPYYRNVCLMMIVGFGLASIQLIPTLEFAQLSVRSQMTFADFVSNSLLWPHLLQLTFPVPWLGLLCYVGILMPILVFLGISTTSAPSQTRFWSGVVIISFLLALGSETWLAHVMYQVPIYNKFRAPVRTLIIADLGMSVLVGYGIVSLQKLWIPTRLLKQSVLVGGAIIFVSLLVIIGRSLPDQSWWRLALPLGLWTVGIVLLISQQRANSVIRRHWLMRLMVLTLAIDLWSYTWLDWRFPGGFGWIGYRSTPAQHRQYLRPSSTVIRYRQQLVENHQRLLPVRGVLGVPEGTLEDMPPMTSLFWGVPSASGYGPLILSRYQKLTEITEMGNFPPSMLTPENRVLDILAVRYVLCNAQLSSPRWRLRESIGPTTTVYENSQVMPRAWMVPTTIPLTAAEILTTIQTSRLPDGRIYEPSQMALVEDSTALLQYPILQPTDRVEILTLEDTEIKIRTQSATTAFLVLSDVYYPGWQVTIDGKSTQIYQTNYVQRGVQVPAGEHVVEYRFEPMSLKIGAGITLVSGIGAGYWLSFASRMYLTRNRKNGVSMN